MNDILSQGFIIICLYGVLGKCFGCMYGWLLESGMVCEVMSVLKYIMEGFEMFMCEVELKGLIFVVFCGCINLFGE